MKLLSFFCNRKSVIFILNLNNCNILVKFLNRCNILILFPKNIYLTQSWLIMFKHGTLVIVGIVTSYKTKTAFQIELIDELEQSDFIGAISGLSHIGP